FTGDKTGSWTVSGGRYAGTATSSAGAVTVLKPGVNVTPEAYVEWESLITSAAGNIGGLVFDYYSSEDYKYVTLDPSGSVTIGPRSRGTVVTALLAGAHVAYEGRR